MSLGNYLKSRIRSFKYAFEGLATLFIHEPNARIHVVAAGVAIFAGVWFSITPAEWALVALAIVLVLAGEAMNTAIENLSNLISPEYHPLIKKAKDVAAAAVLLLALGAVIVGVIIFLPRIKALF